MRGSFHLFASARHIRANALGRELGAVTHVAVVVGLGGVLQRR
jgi:hypothetical protein